jgi:hypothetical protein
VKQRWRTATRYKLCYNCLGQHGRNDCKNRRACGISQCDKKHHRLLHRDAAPQQAQPTATVNVNKTVAPSRAVLLRVVPVVVQGPKGGLTTFALLEDASTVSMVEVKDAEKLWWKEVQQQIFGNDRISTRTGGKFSHRLEKLSPAIDDDGVIRMISKIQTQKALK